MKRYKKVLFFLLGISLMTPSMGFQKKKSKEAEVQALIDTKVTEKVEKFRKEQMAKCRERILNRASELADSIILATAINRTIIDSISRPIPPDRPTRPIVRPPIDTTPVSPFFPIDTSQ